MSVTLKQLPWEPIIVQTMSPDYNLLEELPQDYLKSYALLEQQTQPVFWVMDISQVSDIGIEELLKGTELVATGEKALYRHRNIREVLYIPSKTFYKMAELAAAGLSHGMFGNLKVLIFESMEAALEHARAQL